MFKRKNNPMYNLISDETVTAYDFFLQSTPYKVESYRPAQYVLFDKMSKDVMIPEIDARLSKLYEGEIDEGNIDVLDNMIVNVFMEALLDLEKQHVDHMYTIRRLFNRIHTDKSVMEKHRMLRERELDEQKEIYNSFSKLATTEQEVI